MPSTKQVVQGEFALNAFRVLIPVNALSSYHGNNDILVGGARLALLNDGEG